MRCISFFLFCSISCFIQAGGFDSYEWRHGFKLADAEYQSTLKIEYTYHGEGEYPTDLGLPSDNNLSIFKLQFKVDGKKVEPVTEYKATYWSNGDTVPVLMPPPGGKKVNAVVIYTIRNLFVIPPAPTEFSIECKKLNVGFAPIPGFQFSGLFTATPQKFERTKIAARAGEPSFVMGFQRKGLSGAPNPGLLFLIPKSFVFSFNNLKAVNNDGVQDSDSAATEGVTKMDPNQTPYTMVFYKEDPNRDWLYATTWLQQPSIYLPLGVEIGGHSPTRRLFLGAGESREDLLPWSTTLKPELLSGLPTEMEAEHDGLPKAIEGLRSGLLQKIKVDPSLGRLIVQEKDGATSAAFANLVLATALTQQLKVYAVPAFMTNQKAELLGRLPLGAFARVVTAIKMQDSWYFLDAGEAAWTLSNYDQYIKGKNLVLLDGNTVKAASY